MLADLVQDAGFRHVNGRHGKPEFLGYLRPGSLLESQPAEGLNGAWLKLLFHEVQKAAENVAIVLLIPLAVQLAFGVMDLVQDFLHVAAAAGGRAMLLGPPIIAGAVACDGTQPGAEGAALPRVAKGGQILEYRQKDFLDQVVDLVFRDLLAAQPGDEQGMIQVGEVLPGISIAGLGAQQQALSSDVHREAPEATGAPSSASEVMFVPSCGPSV